MTSCQDFMQRHQNMSHHFLQKLSRASIFLPDSPDSIKQPLICLSSSSSSEKNKYIWSSDIRFVLTEVNQTADVENHQFRIQNVKKKKFPPGIDLSFVFQKVSGGYFTVPQ